MVEGADYARGRALLERLMVPLPKHELVAELGRLRVATAAKFTDASEMALTIAVFADELAAKPGDAVRAALREWPKRNKFWPALQEILELVDEYCAPRLAMAQALGLEEWRQPWAGSA